MENVGPVDDGTESLGDVPSLSEEVAGIDEICTAGQKGSFEQRWFALMSLQGQLRSSNPAIFQ